MDRCTTDEDCPAKSKCILRGCDGKICVCENNTMPSEKDNVCVQSKYTGSADINLAIFHLLFG